MILDRKNSPTRWSYGAARFQPAFHVVAGTIQPSDGDLTSKARALGFDAIVIEKRGYDAGELTQLRNIIESSLRPECKLFDDDRRTFYTLTGPSGSPEVALSMIRLWRWPTVLGRMRQAPNSSKAAVKSEAAGTWTSDLKQSRAPNSLLFRRFKGGAYRCSIYGFSPRGKAEKSRYLCGWPTPYDGNNRCIRRNASTN